MSSPAQQLPPGWTAEWDATSQKYVFIETATGRSQWEPPMGPAMSPDPNIAPSASPPPAHHHRRRQYAAGQTQAYYGSQDAMSAPVYGAPAPAQQQQPQLFTPGLASEGHVQQPGAQPSYYAGAPAEPEYINAPQQPGYSQPPAAPMGGLADQFNQMSMGGQKGPRLYTTNLLESTDTN